MSERPHDGNMDQPRHHQDKRRLIITQLLRSPVLNPAGTEVGRVEDFIVKLGDGTHPPVTGLKVRVGAQDVFIGKDLLESLEPGGVRLSFRRLRRAARGGMKSNANSRRCDLALLYRLYSDLPSPRIGEEFAQPERPVRDVIGAQDGLCFTGPER